MSLGTALVNLSVCIARIMVTLLASRFVSIAENGGILHVPSFAMLAMNEAMLLVYHIAMIVMHMGIVSLLSTVVAIVRILD